MLNRRGLKYWGVRVCLGGLVFMGQGCLPSSWLDSSKSVMVAGIVVNPTILIKDHHLSPSRRTVLGGSEEVRLSPSVVDIVGMHEYQLALKTEVMALIGEKAGAVEMSSQVTGYQRQIMAKELINVALEDTIDAVIHLYIEFYINNHQAYYVEEDATFYSERTAYHWSDRVLGATPSVVETVIYASLYDVATQNAYQETILVYTDSRDISVSWSDLKELDLRKSEWFKGVQAGVIERLREMFY